MLVAPPSCEATRSGIRRIPQPRPKEAAMSDAIQIVTRPVRQITIDTGRPWAEFRAAYEKAVPAFDRMEAIGTVLSNSGWEAIERLSAATAVNGLVSFYAFDPSPVMAVNGNTAHTVTYLSGNIVEAEPGFRQNPGCFLYIPLRVVISAAAGGSAQLTIDHPADLFAAFADPVLDEIAARFAATFAAILAQLDVPVPPALLTAGD
jgi:uncharacterized protein (DUF302 family)